MSDEIEKEIQAKGLTAPRVTPQRINDVLAITRPLHQQRVIEEVAELDSKLEKLRTFTGNHVFADLDLGEQHRLKRQLSVMAEYSDLLHQRIAAFPAQ